MSRDEDLFVSCKCGCTTIQKRGGYTTYTLAEAADLGHTASMLCRRKRLKRRLYFLLVTMVMASILIGVGGWFIGEHGRRRVEMMDRLSLDADEAIRVGDDDKAVAFYTQAISIQPMVVYYLRRGFCRYRQGRYAEAVEDCDSALKLEPQNEMAKVNRALAMKYLSP